MGKTISMPLELYELEKEMAFMYAKSSTRDTIVEYLRRADHADIAEMLDEAWPKLHEQVKHYKFKK